MNLVGDSLSIFLFLASAILGCVIGAVSTEGWRAKVLWAASAVFGVLTLVWLRWPALPPLLIALFHSGALAVLIPVVIVAIVVRREDPILRLLKASEAAEAAKSSPAKQPAFAADLDKLSKWTPDIGFEAGVIYIAQGSRWATRSGRTMGELRDEVVSALYAGKITAWAREHPDDNVEYQVRPMAWGEVQLDVEREYAFFENHGVAAHKLRLSEGETKSAWPPKPAPPSSPA